MVSQHTCCCQGAFQDPEKGSRPAQALKYRALRLRSLREAQQARIPRARAHPSASPHARPACLPGSLGRDSVLVGGVSTGSAVTSRACE